MKVKKQIALNKLFNICVFTGLFFGYGSIIFFTENEMVWGLVFGVVALLLTVLPLIFTPYCYAFDSEGVSLCYVLSRFERYLWKDIYAIKVVDTSTGRTHIFDFFYAYIFSISGENVGQKRAYMKGHIRKSFRTKYLLEKYWDGTITGYLFEDVKKKREEKKAKKAKKQSQINAHMADEIVTMEREMRAATREWLRPFAERAGQNGLEFKTDYLYVTKDFDELRSRPDEGYTYTLIIEIARPGETDENHIAVFEVDMLYVRLGKTAYRGVKNKSVREELEEVLSESLDAIIKNGIEAYCEDIE